MSAEDDPRLEETADALRRSGLSWQEVEADDALRARVLGAAAGDDLAAGRRDRTARRGPGRRLVLGAAAAAVVLVLGGGAVGYVLGSTSTGEDVVTGPPGTLGAVEPVSFAGTPPGVDVRASIVAHTWGTETVLDVSGLRTGERYTVVLEDADGTPLETGSFIAVEGMTDCRMNGAVLRQDVDGLRVLDVDGSSVLAADLPTAPA